VVVVADFEEKVYFAFEVVVLQTTHEGEELLLGELVVAGLEGEDFGDEVLVLEAEAGHAVLEGEHVDAPVDVLAAARHVAFARGRQLDHALEQAGQLVDFVFLHGEFVRDLVEFGFREALVRLHDLVQLLVVQDLLAALVAVAQPQVFVQQAFGQVAVQVDVQFAVDRVEVHGLVLVEFVALRKLFFDVDFGDQILADFVDEGLDVLLDVVFAAEDVALLVVFELLYFLLETFVEDFVCTRLLVRYVLLVEVEAHFVVHEQLLNELVDFVVEYLFVVLPEVLQQFECDAGALDDLVLVEAHNFLEPLELVESGVLVVLVGVEFLTLAEHDQVEVVEVDLNAVLVVDVLFLAHQVEQVVDQVADQHRVLADEGDHRALVVRELDPVLVFELLYVVLVLVEHGLYLLEVLLDDFSQLGALDFVVLLQAQVFDELGAQEDEHLEREVHVALDVQELLEVGDLGVVELQGIQDGLGREDENVAGPQQLVGRAHLLAVQELQVFDYLDSLQVADLGQNLVFHLDDVVVVSQLQIQDFEDHVDFV